MIDFGFMYAWPFSVRIMVSSYAFSTNCVDNKNDLFILYNFSI